MVEAKFDLNITKKNIDLDLVKYIEANVFPLYKKNDKGHDIYHIFYVINRSIRFASSIENIDMNMVFTIAAYHDCGHSIDPKKHEAISANILYNDDNLRCFFNEEQIMIMKEAVEDHRASLKYEPRSIYGKIVSSADRLVDVDIELKRTFEYRRKLLESKSLDFIIEDSRIYLMKKYVGENAKTKMFFDDEDYYAHIEELCELINNKESFTRRYKIVNKIERT